MTGPHHLPGKCAGTSRKAIRHLIVALAAIALITSTRAEEGGSGHYLPGSMSSFMDAVPPKETFIARANFVYYDGSFDSGSLPFAKFAAANVKATSFAAGLTLLWRPPIDLGEKWSFAISATLPYVWMDVSANASAKATVYKGTRFERTISVSPKVSDSKDGLGDMVIMPLMLNYKFTPDFSMNFRVAVYAPTGAYNASDLANTGKNFWTFEPVLALMYFGQKNGFEASMFVGYDMNTENPATNYKSGDQFHIDGTLAQHFPLLGGFAGVGVSGYWYQQLTPDSGEGASFGPFMATTTGLGPVISYSKKVGNIDIIGEVKWLAELETQNRLQGNYIWAKLIFKF